MNSIQQNLSTGSVAWHPGNGSGMKSFVLALGHGHLSVPPYQPRSWEETGRSCNSIYFKDDVQPCWVKPEFPRVGIIHFFILQLFICSEKLLLSIYFLSRPCQCSLIVYKSPKISTSSTDSSCWPQEPSIFCPHLIWPLFDLHNEASVCQKYHLKSLCY